MDVRTTLFHPSAARPASAIPSAPSPGVELPSEFIEDSRRRLRLIALLIMGGSAAILLSDVPSEGLAAVTDGIDTAFRWVAILLSAVLFAVAANRRIPSRAVQNAGLVWEVVFCQSMGIFIPLHFHALGIELGVADRWTELLPFLTWIVPIIVLFPLLVPTSPRKTLFVASLCALTAPFGLLVHDLTARVDPEPGGYLKLVLSPAIAVAIAYCSSRVVYGIGQDVTRARQMGSYHLVELLGEGGMGEVWRARHRLLARPAAIKLVRAETLGEASPETRGLLFRRFEREAQATALLRSPHTIELFDFGIAENSTFYYVMELLEGFDLERLVKTHGPIPSERVIHLLRQVCHSLAEAHEQELIHRDIKPANIFTCRYGREVDFVKVLDFGLVKPRANTPHEVQLTGAHIVDGTPAYMAPEQILGHAAVDGRADIYAVGCVAYWLLTGQIVFEGGSAMEVLTQHVHSSPVPPSERTELRIPCTLDRLVMECLAKDPANRPQNADEMTARLGDGEAAERWTRTRAQEWCDHHEPSSPYAVQKLRRNNILQ
jgi:serine/threonine-protein kinase